MSESDIPDPPGLAELSLGMALLADGRHQQALVKIDEALVALPDLEMAHTMRVYALKGLARHEDALREMLDHPAPGKPEWHANLITSLSLVGKHSEALRAAEEAVALAPDDPVIWYRKGCAERRAVEETYDGKMDNPELLKIAERSLRKAIEIQPNYYLAHLEMGWHLRHRRPAEALQFCQTAIDLKFGDPRMHFLASELAQDRGNLLEARDHLELVVAADPGNEAAMGALYRLQLAESSFVYRATRRLGTFVLRHRWAPIALGIALAIVLINLGVDRKQFLFIALAGALLWWAGNAYHQATYKRWKKAPTLSREF